MDKITMFTNDAGDQIRECVACNYTDALSDQPQAPEIETRVNKKANTDDHTVKQVVFFKAGSED